MILAGNLQNAHIFYTHEQKYSFIPKQESILLLKIHKNYILNVFGKYKSHPLYL